MGKRMPMDDESDAYQTYVLRLWRAHYGGEWQWRASIESPHNCERQVFANLAQLVAYLYEKCNSQVPHTPETGHA